MKDFNDVFMAGGIRACEECGPGVTVNLNYMLHNVSKCSEESFKSGNSGFYFVYYCNDENETVEAANKAKRFITQFGPITTGYPWYMAYCKRPDESVYARYGSLHATKGLKLRGSDQAFDLYNSYINTITAFGKEIKYVWTGQDSGGGDAGETFPPGEWTPKYRDAKDYAERANLPYIGVVSKNDEGCHFCAIFRPKIEGQKFLQWAKGRNAVLGLFKNQSPYDTDREWTDWARGDYTGYPFVRFHWKKKDGTVVDDIFMGRNTSIGDNDGDGVDGTVEDLIARFEKDCGG